MHIKSTRVMNNHFDPFADITPTTTNDSVLGYVMFASVYTYIYTAFYFFKKVIIVILYIISSNTTNSYGAVRRASAQTSLDNNIFFGTGMNQPPPSASIASTTSTTASNDPFAVLSASSHVIPVRSSGPKNSSSNGGDPFAGIGSSFSSSLPPGASSRTGSRPQPVPPVSHTSVAAQNLQSSWNSVAVTANASNTSVQHELDYDPFASAAELVPVPTSKPSTSTQHNSLTSSTSSQRYHLSICLYVH